MCKTPFTRYNRLSNRFDNMLYRVNKHPTGCRTCLTTGCRTCWTTGWMFVYTIQLVVKPCLTNRFDNRVERTDCCSTRLSNRLYNPVWQPAVYTIQLFCETGCQTGLTTGWMFVYMIQPVIKPAWQPVVSCKRGLIPNCLYCQIFYNDVIHVEASAPYAHWTDLLISTINIYGRPNPCT